VTEIEARGPGEWDMQVLWLDVDQLVPNDENPNVQDDATFNGLVESIETDGWTAPLQAVSIGALDGKEMYEIVAGEHRWRAGKVLQCKVPVIALPKQDFDEDRRQWALVKDNILKGSLNPEKFSKLYDRMAKKYDPEVLKALMGFTTSDAFQKVYRQAKENLPPELQKALEEAKDEIKTIDDLSRVLNRLFQAHGETLPSNFMVFSYGSKDVLWVRADKELWSIVDKLAKHTEKLGQDFAAVMTEALRDYRPPAEIPGAALAPEFVEA
jgi:hypothetical protein